MSIFITCNIMILQAKTFGVFLATLTLICQIYQITRYIRSNWLLYSGEVKSEVCRWNALVLARHGADTQK